MKNLHLPMRLLLALLFLQACTLEKDRDISPGTTNEQEPKIDRAEVNLITKDKLELKAWLSILGNLNIAQHGWVWGDRPTPTLNDHLDKLEFGKLAVDSFETQISGQTKGLTPGTTYYFRPFVTNGTDTHYGPEICSFLGPDFTINTDVEIFQGAIVQFTNTSLGHNTYYWDFGEDTSQQHSPVRTFNTLGNIKVQFNIDNGTCTIKKELVLKVIDNPFKDYWVTIAGGPFLMGCTQMGCEEDSTQLPAHDVTVKAFTLGQNEITQKQWIAVMGNNPSFNTSCGLNCPVENVSWYLIKDQFIPALYRKTGRKHRLPTEAEWEYAARGGKNFRFSGDDTLNNVGWHGGNSADTLHQVRQKKANDYGLYDMSGNVREWVEDCYHPDYYNNPPKDGSAWLGCNTGDDRVLRGGSFNIDRYSCRVTTRFSNIPFYGSYNYGFRLVRE